MFTRMLVVFALLAVVASAWMVARTSYRKVAPVHPSLMFRGSRRTIGGGDLDRSSSMALFSTQFPTDEEMSNWLDDMVFSGDMQGYMRKRAKDVVQLDFIEYVEERKELSKEADEQAVFSEVVEMLKDMMRSTDGLSDSGVAFENRLDKILFTAPNKRADLIKGEMAAVLTPGFVQFVQGELKSTTDTDSKVVLASILQLIGQAKGEDLLGKDSAVLMLADSSLGDQFSKSESELLAAGVMETKEAFGVGDRNEQILASLLFSQNDILEDVLNNLHEIDERFTSFLQKKIDETRDIEERSGLVSLLQTVTVVLDRVKEVQGTDMQETPVEQEELTIDQLKQRMQEVQMGSEMAAQESKKSPMSFSVQADKKASFQKILERFLGLTDAALIEAVKFNYELCDYEFMEMLAAEAQSCFAEGADEEGKQYQELAVAINAEMVSRLGSAQDRLQKILSKKGVKMMESEVVAMVRRGEVDEALVLLIEVNIQQAEKAGVKQAADVLRILLKRVIEERERKLPDEQRLLRALLRQSDSEKRKELLFEAFKPMKSMNAETGAFTEGAPLISPPSFINVARQFITNFGNVEGFDIMGQALAIIDEAEVVATELYGEGMTAKQHQKFIFDKQTISVWDLGDYEDAAMMSGEEVPWRNDKFDHLGPEDVVGERVKKIGGSE